MRTRQRGFSLLETFVALILVAVSMTALIVAFVNSGKYGVLSRRQATAVAVARSQAAILSHVSWPAPAAGGGGTAALPCDPTLIDPSLKNNNTGNDDITSNSKSFADPNGLFAQKTLPTGADAPDVSLGTITVGNESFDTYVNVAPQYDDPVGKTGLQGMMFAVIVRYKVGEQFMRAVALGFRYCPTTLSVGQLPI